MEILRSGITVSKSVNIVSGSALTEIRNLLLNKLRRVRQTTLDEFM